MGYKVLFIILCLWGLYLNSGIPEGTIRWGVLDYYTIQSNLLCLIYFVASFISNLKHWIEEERVFTFLPRGKGAVVFAIAVTALIYHILLRPLQFSMGMDRQVYALGNVLVHYIVPVMVFMDWLAFDPKGKFRIYDPFLWLILPFLYFIFSVVRAQIGGTILNTASRYPYGFINIDELGLEKVLLNMAEIALIFLVLGYLYYLLDRGLRRVQKEDLLV